jgi:ABC-2 type transport system ATP-binding protein
MNVNPEPVIVADGLTRRFGEVVAVDHLSLEVRSGEIFGFLGHNGAGKTTSVRLFNGILAPSDGQARVLGLRPMLDGPSLRRRTGVLTETPSLDERLTGRENLAIYADLYNVPEAAVASRVREMLESFDLADRADQKVGDYSKGMKQRMALARALLHQPELLFLDEPTSGLDPVAARHVHELILQLSHEEEHTVFLCTHNLIEAQNLCDRVAVLEHGKLVAVGTPRELARQLDRRLRLEIEVAPDGLPAALEIVKARLAPAEPAQDRGVITVAGADRESIPGLIAALAGAGVKIYRVTPQEPSLEDVYFALHGEEEGA